jgi:DNA invertase Pin-like site-specific DNA recombinase
MIKIIPTRLEATNKIKERISQKTYDEVAEEIGITRPTLYARLAENNWKKSELVLIRDL